MKPRFSTGRRMRLLGVSWKLLRAMVHAGHGFWVIKIHFPKLDEAERAVRVHVWAGKMLRIVDIELVVNGTPPAEGPVLLVANHISWLDILVMHASRHCRFVSKSDVKTWPVVSTLAAGAGTLYVERESRRTPRHVDQMRHGVLRRRFGQLSRVAGVEPASKTDEEGKHLLALLGMPFAS